MAVHNCHKKPLEVWALYDLLCEFTRIFLNWLFIGLWFYITIHPEAALPSTTFKTEIQQSIETSINQVFLWKGKARVRYCSFQSASGSIAKTSTLLQSVGTEVRDTDVNMMEMKLHFSHFIKHLNIYRAYLARRRVVYLQPNRTMYEDAFHVLLDHQASNPSCQDS